MPSEGLAKAFLSTVRQQLLQGNIKKELVLQQEIDETEYYSWSKANK